MRHNYSSFIADVTGTFKCSVSVDIVQVPRFLCFR